MKGDRVEILVDTGGGVQRFEVAATRAGRRIEVSTARGVVEVSEVTRSGVPVRSARFMSTRVVALVEHPALETPVAGVEETTRRRLGRAGESGGGPARGRSGRAGREPADGAQLALLADPGQSPAHDDADEPPDGE